MKKIFFISLFSLIASMADSQIHERDSLKNLLATKMKDTARVMALVQLSFFEQNIDSALK